jgi:hypothetical protein
MTSTSSFSNPTDDMTRVVMNIAPSIPNAFCGTTGLNRSNVPCPAVSEKKREHTVMEGHTATAGNKRRKIAPTKSGKLAYYVPGTWKCDVCLANLNSVGEDHCEVCREPRPASENKPTGFGKLGLLVGSEGVVGRINQHAFVFAATTPVAQTMTGTIPGTPRPLFRRRVRAKRPTAASTNPVANQSKPKTRSRTAPRRKPRRKAVAHRAVISSV